jgi:hypothetical protein
LFEVVKALKIGRLPVVSQREANIDHAVMHGVDQACVSKFKSVAEPPDAEHAAPSAREFGALEGTEIVAGGDAAREAKDSDIDATQSKCVE